LFEVLWENGNATNKGSIIFFIRIIKIVSIVFIGYEGTRLVLKREREKRKPLDLDQME
jgi:hypothetical protein